MENSHDFCGTCTRCIDACPTGALSPGKTMDARKCISYLSIESREIPPAPLREAWGDWFFGCDICQSVCPWNAKPFSIDPSEKKPILDLSSSKAELLESDLRWILSASGKALEKSFRGTALSRAGSFGLKRNALIVSGNRRLKNLTQEITDLLDHPRLGDLAAWALQKIENHLEPKV